MPAPLPLRFTTAFSVYIAGLADKLGEGGNGTVYLAKEESTGEAVAVKVLDPHKATEEKARRFRNEIHFGQRAEHPHVVPVLGSGRVVLGGRDSPFYVMPRYDATLRDLIAQRHIAADRVLPLYEGLLDGVEAAHLRRVVHRDLKPENVLYDKARDALVVADFGIARFSEDEAYTAVETRRNARVANFLYAAPEQRAPGQEVDARADIFALGLILNEMFTGEVPLGAGYRTVQEVAPRYARVDPLVELMRQQSCEDRPATIAEVRERLPSRTADDALVRDPIRVAEVEATGPTRLVLVLNRAPTATWERIAAGVSSDLNGRLDPSKFAPWLMPIVGNRVTIGVDPDGPVGASDLACSYAEFLNRVRNAYPHALERERESAAQAAVVERAEAESRRAAVKRQLGL